MNRNGFKIAKARPRNAYSLSKAKNCQTRNCSKARASSVAVSSSAEHYVRISIVLAVFLLNYNSLKILKKQKILKNFICGILGKNPYILIS